MPEHAVAQDISASTRRNATSKPWSSGRVLTRAQRERKLIMNRVSQARKRQEVKSAFKNVEARLLKIEQRCMRYISTPTLKQYTFDDCIRSIKSKECDGTDVCDLLNDILGSVYYIDPFQICRDEHFNQDTVIRGIVTGWHVLERHDFVCPIWIILKRLDAIVLDRATVPTRLALLRGIHGMLLARKFSDNAPPLPPWYGQRDYYQAPNSGNNVNDYFAWPRFRKKLITSKNSPLTNRFWHCFSRNVQFQWNLDPAQTIDIDQEESGKFHLTMTFRDATDELHRYSMGDEFFGAYPEYFEDVYGPVEM